MLRKHNLVLLASSFSYYATLGLAPLLLILFAIASLIGDNFQHSIMSQVQMIAPDLTEALSFIFTNLKGRVDLGSFSGLFGLAFLIFLSSLIFKHLRYSFDIIYGDFNPTHTHSFWEFLKERGFIMLIALFMCSLFLLSLLINPIIQIVLAYSFKSLIWEKILQLALSFIILSFMFTGLYMLTPTRKNKLFDCMKMAFMTSLTFQFGNMLTGLYMRTIATNSLYGATGALLVFLLWAFYSALMIFLSVELFEFLKRRRKNMKGLI